jgi:hypothetical protein
MPPGWEIFEGTEFLLPVASSMSIAGVRQQATTGQTGK